MVKSGHESDNWIVRCHTRGCDYRNHIRDGIRALAESQDASAGIAHAEKRVRPIESLRHGGGPNADGVGRVHRRADNYRRYAVPELRLMTPMTPGDGCPVTAPVGTAT